MTALLNFIFSVDSSAWQEVNAEMMCSSEVVLIGEITVSPSTEITWFVTPVAEAGKFLLLSRQCDLA